MFFIGVTRFSLFYPHAPGWNLTDRYSSIDEYERELFSPSRLDPRIDVFTQYSLPQLERGSEEYDYRHVVQISPQLPAYAKERLHSAAEQYPFLVISEHADARSHRTDIDSLIRSFAAESDSSDGIFARFRLDDDDVLSQDYFEQLSQYVRAENIGLNVSFGLGYQAIFFEDTIFDLRNLYHPRNSMGMAQICKIRHSGSIEWKPFTNHARSDLEVPTILDSRIPTVMSLKHNGQDTFAGQSSDGVFGNASRLLAHEKPADYKDLFERFPTVENSTVGGMFSAANPRGGEYPVELTTEAQALDVNIRAPGIYEIDIEYSSSDFGDEKRFFVSLPTNLIETQHPWNHFMAGSVVAGIPFQGSQRARLPLLLRSGERVESISVWQSKASGDSNRIESVHVRGKQINDQ